MASIVSAGTTSATALNMSADTSGVLQLASNNGTVALTVTTAQLVGIGTSSPSYLLDVAAQGGAPNYIRYTSGIYQPGGFISARDSSSGGAYSGYNFTQGGTTYGYLRNYGDIYGGSLDSSMELWNVQNSFMRFGTNNTERMRITSGGYVGIGSSSAAALFTVAGGAIGTASKKAAFYTGGDEVGVTAARNEAIRIGRSDIEGNYYSSIWSSSGSSGDESLHWLKFYITNGNGTSQTLACTMNGSGNVQVAGALSKGSGSFRIDHPLLSMSETHELVHSFIEGPKADLIYRGKVSLVNGSAVVNIDNAADMTEGTFVILCRDVQCFTTNESDWTSVRGSVSGNILTIEAEDNTSKASISWMVIGERQDKHMMDTEWTDENGKVIVEPLKTDLAPKTVQTTTGLQGAE